MLALASYAMRGPFQAALPATLFLLLALVLPPLAWLSGAVIGLVFLRKGLNQGVITFGVAAAAAGLFTFWLGGSFIAGLKLVSVFWLPVILLSVILRETVDLGRTILAAGVFAILVVLGMYLVMDDPARFWEQMVLEQFPIEDFSRQLQVDSEALKTAVSHSATMMSGAFVTVMLLGVLLSLLLARYWQAALFNPGGFKSEFHDLRLGTLPAAMAIAISILALLLGLPVFKNIAPIAIALFFFQGLAVFHQLVAVRNMSKGWLIGIYILLLFLLPHTMILLGALGMADNWLNIRKRASE